MKVSFRCEDCGHVFDADIGGEDSEFEIYRCEDCDRVLRAEKSEQMPDTLIEACGCGGIYWKGRPPKCTHCRSANVVQTD